MQRLRKRLQAEATRITDAYEHYLGVDEGQGADICQPIEAGQTSEENILTIALSRLMRLRLRAPPFKVCLATLVEYRTHTVRAIGYLREFARRYQIRCSGRVFSGQRRRRTFRLESRFSARHKMGRLTVPVYKQGRRGRRRPRGPLR